MAFWAGSFERAGTQRFLVELLSRIDRERFDPVVMSTAKRGELLPVIESLGVPVHEFGTGASALSAGTVRGLPRAASFLRRERVEILSCMLGLTTIVGPFVGRAARVPVVVNNQRNLSYWLTGGTKEKVYGYANRRVVDAVLVNSAAAARELVERFRVPERKIVNVGVGIDLTPYSVGSAVRGAAVDAPGDTEGGAGSRHVLRDGNLARELGTDGHPVVGIVGKLSDVKGHEHFLAAAAVVARSLPDARFLIVGDGARRQELGRVADELGIADAVIFAGVREDVPRVLGLMDAFALSSTSEGTPNVLMEAMAAGLPVVATDVGGVPEVVERGSSGLLVPAGDGPAMGRALLEILSDPARACSMGERGRTLARESHDIAAVVTKVEDTFAALLRAAGGSRTGADRTSSELRLGQAGEAGRKP